MCGGEAAIHRDVIAPGLAELAARHPSVGDVRGLGVFWAIELVKVPRHPRAAGPMNEGAAACEERGLWPLTHVTGRSPRRTGSTAADSGLRSCEDE